ncbi:hypothetical protein TRIUR3_08642 [Triticum urartu]|uniref:Iron-related transcription factor 3 bHLH domain-containing protein n=1 Tax=Triticum urartu TaxID=4572 RepID=M8A8D1_TRIUA|nr:hypothetical protein TRIUR3_08642 [Triticum urartu]
MAELLEEYTAAVARALERLLYCDGVLIVRNNGNHVDGAGEARLRAHKPRIRDEEGWMRRGRRRRRVWGCLGRSEGHVTDDKCKKKAPRRIHKSKRQKHKRVLLNDFLGELIKMLDCRCKSPAH